MAIADLVLLLLLFGPPLFLGVPAILNNVKLPRQLGIVPLDLAALTPKQREDLELRTAELAPLGFRFLSTFESKNLDGKNQFAVYLSDAEPIMIADIRLYQKQLEVETEMRYVEIMSELEGGPELSTRNNEIDELFDKVPGQIIQHRPGEKNLSVLLEFHRQRLRPLLAGASPRHVSHFGVDDIVVELERSHQRGMEHQLACGLLQPDPESPGTLRATKRLAMRGVRTFLSPVHDGLANSWRLPVALFLGVALPSLVVAVVPPVSVLTPDVLRVVALVPTAMGMGFALAAKAFHLTALAAYAHVRIYTELSPWLGVGIAMGAGAIGWQVANWASRRAVTFRRDPA